MNRVLHTVIRVPTAECCCTRMFFGSVSLSEIWTDVFTAIKRKRMSANCRHIIEMTSWTWYRQDSYWSLCCSKKYAGLVDKRLKIKSSAERAQHIWWDVLSSTLFIVILLIIIRDQLKPGRVKYIQYPECSLQFHFCLPCINYSDQLKTQTLFWDLALFSFLSLGSEIID